MGVKMDSKTLHIDTLYLSYNCDFSAYLEALEIIAEKKHLYYRDGRQFYDFGYARVGWLDWEICQKSKNYPFVIEYNFEYLYQNDLINNIDSISLPFHDDLSLDRFQDIANIYLIKRLDYNCTFHTMHKDILQSLFVSKHFKKGHDWWGTDREVETINLGMRRTGKTFRLYNKSKELSDKKNFIKSDMLKQVFGTKKNLYSLEVEVHRKYIISKLKNNGSLLYWHSVVDLCITLLGSVKYCKNTRKNLALIRSKNYDKIDFTYIHKFIGAIPEYKKAKKYEKSTQNLLIAIEGMLEQFNSYGGLELTPEDLSYELENYFNKNFEEYTLETQNTIMDILNKHKLK